MSAHFVLSKISPQLLEGPKLLLMDKDLLLGKMFDPGVPLTTVHPICSPSTNLEHLLFRQERGLLRWPVLSYISDFLLYIIMIVSVTIVNHT